MEHLYNDTYNVYITASDLVTVSFPFDLEEAELVASAVVEGGIPTPATYYGWITPTVGMIVTGPINGSEVGRTEVIELDGRLVYVIHIVPASVRDCGPTANEVVFTVGDQVMDHNRGWDNSQAHFHALSVAIPRERE